ncbi:hypothetical protein U1Q18_036114, partial [Sarracenia purpurea var. burkii]
MRPIFSKNSGSFTEDCRTQQSHTTLSRRLPMFHWRRRRLVPKVAVCRSIFHRRQTFRFGGRSVVSTVIFRENAREDAREEIVASS